MRSRRVASGLIALALFAGGGRLAAWDADAGAGSRLLPSGFEPPPADLGAALRSALRPSNVAVALGGGNRIRIWLARRIPSATELPSGAPPVLRRGVSYRIAAGALVGVIAFSSEWHDFKGQRVPAGTYALGYAIQPLMKEHQGVSDFRDFLILVRPRDYRAAAGDPGRLAAASRTVTGTGHPAVLALLPRGSDGEPPRLETGMDGRVVLETRTGDTALALTLMGAGRLESGPDAPPAAGPSADPGRVDPVSRSPDNASGRNPA